MSFRARLLAAFFLAVLLPMIVLALVVREEMTDRLRKQYDRRVTGLVLGLEEDLAEQSQAIAVSLAALKATIIDDNRFRRAAVDKSREERRYLLDYAAKNMNLTGLSMMQIQDETGRILSSGHFRNEFDRLEPALPQLLGTLGGGPALVEARAPDAPFLALVGADSFQMSGRKFTIVAGVKVESRFIARLVRSAELEVTIDYPGGMLYSHGDENGTHVPVAGDRFAPGEIVRDLKIPFIDTVSGKLLPARIRVTHKLTELEELRRSVDRWFLVALLAACLLAVLLASWLASKVSKPLEDLADKTSRIDLDRLNIDFTTHRRDEIGALSRLLGAMTERLRSSAVRIKDAEHRATLGELARQVNHDIKNGLIPLRNVFRHLCQVARENANQLPEIFRQREDTVDSSISYLEDLASNYGRLYHGSERGPCDLNTVVKQVVDDLSGTTRADIRMNLVEGAVVLGDTLALRRIVENVVGNAIDSLGQRPGSVTVSTMKVHDQAGEPGVRITVRDTGIGMSEEELAKVFDDFYTTKEGGTGLGLSIVRRLVMDLNGSIHLESTPGVGTCLSIELPGAGTEIHSDENGMCDTLRDS